jgi:hypothetical protein
VSPGLDFQARFANDVAAGRKRMTMRRSRADGRDPKAGDTLKLWTGLRTTNTRKLGEFVCVSAVKVEMDEAGLVWIDKGPIGGHHGLYLLSIGEMDELARADGFHDSDEMLAWFQKTHSLPFRGVLLRW